VARSGVSSRGAGGAGGSGLASPLIRPGTRPAASSTSAGPIFPASMSWITTATPGGVLRVPLFHRRTFLSLVQNHRAAERCLSPKVASARPNSVVAAARGRRCLSGILSRSGAPEWTKFVIVLYLIMISISIRSHRAYDAIINETAALGAPRLVETAGVKQDDGAEKSSQTSF